jgi:hypothetical protein
MSLNRKHLVMSNLLYPAFLGTFIYSAVDTINQDIDFVYSPAGLLVICLLIHFVMDYLYSVDQPTARGGYSIWQFALDIGIVVCLFFALRAALQQSVPLGLSPVIWLSIMKVGALFWEVSELKGGHWTKIKLLEVSMDTFFAFVYVVLAFSLSAPASLVLSIVVLADACGYWIHDYYAKQWKHSCPPTTA